MSSSREAILGSIRQALGRTGPVAPASAAELDQRLADHQVHVQPALEGDLPARFVAKLEAVAGSVARVSRIDDVAGAVLAYLDRNNLPREFVATDDAVLSEIQWPERVTVGRRAAGAEDRVSVTGAFTAVAETGSVVLLSGAATPTTLNFLPEDHIVVLRAAQIVPHIEDVWVRLRAEFGALPRTINFITGPSRTADVEQTIQIGAHGPRRLHVVLIGD